MPDSPSQFDIAVAAYRKSCDRNDLTFQQPNEDHSNGYVARYDIKRRRMLI